MERPAAAMAAKPPPAMVDWHGNELALPAASLAQRIRGVVEPPEAAARPVQDEEVGTSAVTDIAASRLSLL